MALSLLRPYVAITATGRNREQRIVMPNRQPGERPPNLKPPAHWGPSPPVPQPEAVTPEPAGEGPDPVRYGDWEKKGMAIDF